MSAPRVHAGPGRAGFTLLEVMIALVLTGVVALMAFASAGVSAEASAMVQHRLAALRSERAARQWLLDLLHNVRPAREQGDTSLALAGDSLTFTAAGVTPLDPERDWLVTIRPGPHGLALAARALGRGPAARVALPLGHFAGWQVRVLPPRGREWQPSWAPAPVLPAAVAITIWNDERAPRPPLVVRLSDAAAGFTDFDQVLD